MRPELSAAFDVAREIAETLSNAFNDGIDFDVSYEEMVDDKGQPHVFVSSDRDLTEYLPKTIDIRGGYKVTVHTRNLQKGMQ